VVNGLQWFFAVSIKVGVILLPTVAQCTEEHLGQEFLLLLTQLLAIAESKRKVPEITVFGVSNSGLKMERKFNKFIQTSGLNCDFHLQVLKVMVICILYGVTLVSGHLSDIVKTLKKMHGQTCQASSGSS
jgi:hypothetical protein